MPRQIVVFYQKGWKRYYQYLPLYPFILQTGIICKMIVSRNDVVYDGLSGLSPAATAIGGILDAK